MNNSVKLPQFRYNSVPAPIIKWVNNTQDYSALIKHLTPTDPALLATLSTLQTLERVALYVGLLCVSQGCRISEVLGLETRNLRPNGFAIIAGAKGSNARLIYTFMPEWLVAELAQADPMAKPFTCTYNQVWRIMSKLNLGAAIQGHANKAVTHQGRYFFAKQAVANLGLSAARGVIGHRGARTIEGYAMPKTTNAKRKRQKMTHIEKEIRRNGLTFQEWLELTAKIAECEIPGVVYVV